MAETEEKPAPMHIEFRCCCGAQLFIEYQRTLKATDQYNTHNDGLFKIATAMIEAHKPHGNGPLAKAKG